MKSIFVITLSEAIGLGIVALIIVISIIVGICGAVKRAFCKHAELYPPATSFGGPGHGWQCKKCSKDFGWGERPSSRSGSQE